MYTHANVVHVSLYLKSNIVPQAPMYTHAEYELAVVRTCLCLGNNYDTYCGKDWAEHPDEHIVPELFCRDDID